MNLTNVKEQFRPADTRNQRIVQSWKKSKRKNHVFCDFVSNADGGRSFWPGNSLKEPSVWAQTNWKRAKDSLIWLPWPWRVYTRTTSYKPRYLPHVFPESEVASSSGIFAKGIRGRIDANDWLINGDVVARSLGTMSRTWRAKFPVVLNIVRGRELAKVSRGSSRPKSLKHRERHSMSTETCRIRLQGAKSKGSKDNFNRQPAASAWIIPSLELSICIWLENWRGIRDLQEPLISKNVRTGLDVGAIASLKNCR